jgi:hypothetical protein
MPEHHLPPTRIPVWGWILMLLALAMLVGLLVVVGRDHRRVRDTARGPAGADAPMVVATG